MNEQTNSTFRGLMGSDKVGSSLNEPIRESATERETQSLHATLSELQKLVSILSDRLTPVSRQPLSETGSDVRAEEPIPALANAIRQSRYLAQSTISHVNDIIARLDI